MVSSAATSGSARCLRERYEARPPEPIAGVPEALAALRAEGVRVALTTGFARDVADPLLARSAGRRATG